MKGFEVHVDVRALADMERAEEAARAARCQKPHKATSGDRGVGAQGVEPSRTLAARVQSRLVGIAVGCEASDARARDRSATRGMWAIDSAHSRVFSFVFVLHDTPKYAIADWAT